MTRQADIIVLGLGPAGASAALAAAKSGAQVIGFDRKLVPGEPVQCAEFVPTLIGNEVRGLAQTSVQSINAMNTIVEAEPDWHTPNFPGRMIDRAAFDAGLAQQARDAGADLQFGISVKSIDDQGIVSLSNGETITGKFIIGADGPRSVAGQAIGSVNHEIVETRQISVDLSDKHSATDIWLSSDMPGGYGWLFPKQNKANIGLGVDSAHKPLLKPALERLHAGLVEQGRVGAEVHGWTGGAIPVGGLIRSQGKLGQAIVLLAGDAAGLTHPVTGAGITSAIISGRLAGEAAIAALGGEVDAVDEYEEELQDLFGPALNRALKHRRRLLATLASRGRLEPDELRSGWIAFETYWAA